MIQVKFNEAGFSQVSAYFICDTVDKMKYVQEIVHSFGVQFTTLFVDGKWEVWPACGAVTARYIEEELGPNVIRADWHTPDDHYAEFALSADYGSDDW